MAGTGPIPIKSGGTPATANPTMRAIGSAPNRAAMASDMTTVAAAPSDIWEAFPAVTLPPFRNTGRKRPSASILVSARGPSSTENG